VSIVVVKRFMFDVLAENTLSIDCADVENISLTAEDQCSSEMFDDLPVDDHIVLVDLFVHVVDALLHPGLGVDLDTVDDVSELVENSPSSFHVLSSQLHKIVEDNISSVVILRLSLDVAFNWFSFD
jgi:hypothetical protein